jgi:hypothetical protein
MEPIPVILANGVSGVKFCTPPTCDCPLVGTRGGVVTVGSSRHDQTVSMTARTYRSALGAGQLPANTATVLDGAEQQVLLKYGLTAI